MASAEIVALVRTQGSPEQVALRRTLEERGRTFTLTYFGGRSGVNEDTLARVYRGMEVDEEEFRMLQRIMRERLTDD